ncbi:MAG: SgcJ/EcaC family oxidoreductase [Candidatus Rokuibacteriota bacterium]
MSAQKSRPRQVYERILLAWNQRDAGAMAARFEEDGNLVGFDGGQVDSRRAIEDHLWPQVLVDV